ERESPASALPLSPSSRGEGAGLLSASREICSAQAEIEPDSGAPMNSACGASEKPLRSSGSEASRKSVTPLPRLRGAVRSSRVGRVVLSGDLAMFRIWVESGQMERVEWRQRVILLGAPDRR